MHKTFNSKKIIDYNLVEKFFKKIKKNKTTVLCHGVFDIVHPGHIRHFTHCKKQADILIVSLTKDMFINKGDYRPFVPEKLRAFNLSALEIIDYVIIDQNKSPINLLKKIKPNFFAKGMEYSDFKNPLTKIENKVVEGYGGKMIFSPGDFVMSSTKILTESKPDIKYEKLKLLMDTESIDFKDLKQILKKIHDTKVHILGDTIIDTIHDCDAIGGLHKTPTLSIAKKNSENYLGGAAIVASHFKSFAKEVSFTTILSNDEMGKFAKQKLNKLKIKTNILEENNRPTTNKNSYIVNNHKLLKVDEVNNTPILKSTLDLIKTIIKSDNSQLFIFSDFRHGIFNKNSIEDLISSLKKNSFKAADSQVASRWGNIADFRKFDLITPTEREARYALFEQDLPIRTLIAELIEKSKVKNIILKLGEKGIISLGKNKKDYIALNSFVSELKDSNGAGDALLAYSAATLFHTKSLIIASIIGSFAAACKCEMVGNIPVTINAIINKIESIEKYNKYK